MANVDLNWLDCMEMGELQEVTDQFKIRAVPGGWIYYQQMTDLEVTYPQTGGSDETNIYRWHATFVPDPRGRESHCR